MAYPILELHHIEKSFSGVRALHPLTLSIYRGEVVGLVGENGAGKSTLIRLISGVHRPDGGTMRWEGRTEAFAGPSEALAAGIATIHQELAYFAHLPVAENLLMGEPWPRRRWGGVDWTALHAEARRRLDHFEIPLPTDRLFQHLSAAEKQEVAMARALWRKSRLLILDEPTASLSEPEVERLFRHLNRMRAQGVAILYISHRLDEILRLADRVVVLRDGACVASYPTAETDAACLIRDMVGRPLDRVYPHTRRRDRGPVLLALHGVGREGMFRDISLAVHAGEIVGLAGLVGAGRSEVARAVYGLYPVDRGRMTLLGQPWRPAGADQALRHQLVYLPEERKRQALAPHHSLRASISLGFSDLITRMGLIDRDRERERVEHAIASYRIQTTGPEQMVSALSGGNQQKTVLARWLEREPAVILLDEPTRGVDVGAKAEIHALMDRLAADGKAILLISSDLPEVLGMSDRVLVMRDGAIATELTDEAMTQENVLRATSGLDLNRNS